MAKQIVTRVHVMSSIRDLAKHVQKLMPAIIVENIPYNNETTFHQGFEHCTEELKAQLRDIEILLCDGDALLPCLKANAIPKLKWAQGTWAGVDMVMTGLNFKKPMLDMMLTRSGDAFGGIMAEYVVGNIIARERNFAGMREKQLQKEWSKQEFFYFRPLSTLTIGILGCGTIGKKVAAACKFMGMTVWAVNRTRSPSPVPYVDQFRGFGELEEVLQNCDYICSIMPYTKETTDLLSGDVLKLCKEKKTIFINIGRGNVINDESLAKAIREGWIGGAILDVFNQEPLPASSELWTLPNVFISPHVSGPSKPDQVAKSFVNNLKLYLAGKPLQHLVDWERGY